MYTVVERKRNLLRLLRPCRVPLRGVFVCQVCPLGLPRTSKVFHLRMEATERRTRWRNNKLVDVYARIDAPANTYVAGFLGLIPIQQEFLGRPTA